MIYSSDSSESNNNEIHNNQGVELERFGSSKESTLSTPSNGNCVNDMMYGSHPQTHSSSTIIESNHEPIVNDAVRQRMNILSKLTTGIPDNIGGTSSVGLGSLTATTSRTINDNPITIKSKEPTESLRSEESVEPETSDNNSTISTLMSGNSQLAHNVMMPTREITIPTEKITTSSPTTQIVNPMGNKSEDLNEEKCIPLETQCDTGKCSVDDNLYPILDPRFNMREAAKQCLLLEDHLNNIKKRCYDCIRKHFLTVDGFLEEAVGLERDNKEREYYRDLYLKWVKLEKQYSQNPRDSTNLDELSKKIRMFRKPLLEKYFDTVSEYSD